MPLYPNEDVLWDENVVPSVTYTGDGCLALPKLNLQFLTLQDYLLRNFNLFRLEAACRFERTSPTRCDASDRGATRDGRGAPVWLGAHGAPPSPREIGGDRGA